MNKKIALSVAIIILVIVLAGILYIDSLHYGNGVCEPKLGETYGSIDCRESPPMQPTQECGSRLGSTCPYFTKSASCSGKLVSEKELNPLLVNTGGEVKNYCIDGKCGDFQCYINSCGETSKTKYEIDCKYYGLSVNDACSQDCDAFGSDQNSPVSCYQLAPGSCN